MTNYDKYTSSYSGTDMIVSFVFPGAAPILVGTATTLTYSIYRQLAHVRTMGRISSKGYARGGRTVAGTIIFTVVNQSFVEDIRDKVKYLGDIKRLKTDELPPFDIVLTFANEFGQASRLVIYGVSFTDETKTLSIEDIFTENVLSFLARDIDHMLQIKTTMGYGGSGSFRGNTEDLGKFKVGDLIANIEADARKKRLDELTRMEKERWKEPVMTEPAAPKNDSNGGGGSGGGGNAPSPGTPGEGVYGRLKIRVYDSSKNPRRALAGATVTYDDPMGNGKQSFKTDKNGWATIMPKYDIKFKYTATKSGYSSASKTITLKKSKGTMEESMEINKVSKSAGPGGDPAAKETVAYANYNGPTKYKESTNNNQTIGRIWDNGDGPKLKLTNVFGKPMSSIPVEYTYTITNYKDWPFYKKTLGIGTNGWSAKGGLGVAYTDVNGNVSMPVWALNDLFDGAILKIVAKPFNQRDTNSGQSKSLQKAWYFKKYN